MPATIDPQSIRLRKWSPDSPDSPAQSQTHVPCIVASSHMYDFLDPEKLRERIEFALKALESWVDKFDAIAFRGMSGALIAPPVALALGKSLILVRKPGDKTHSDYRVEGDYNARSYVVLDDFTSSGTTQLEIRKAISCSIPKATCIGVLEVSYITPEGLSSDKEFYGRYRLAYASSAYQRYSGKEILEEQRVEEQIKQQISSRIGEVMPVASFYNMKQLQECINAFNQKGTAVSFS